MKYSSRDVLFEFHLNFGIPPVLIFQLEVYYKVDRLLTGLTAQPKGTTARWYSNKTSLCILSLCFGKVLKIVYSTVSYFYCFCVFLEKFSFPHLSDKSICRSYIT